MDSVATDLQTILANILKKATVFQHEIWALWLHYKYIQISWKWKCLQDLRVCLIMTETMAPVVTETLQEIHIQIISPTIDLSPHMKLKCCINQFSRFLIQLCWKYWDYFLFHISATVFWPKHSLSQIIRQLAHSKKVHASEMSIIC